jgi:diguanylate cyclase (GGDEF)-like protein
MFELTPSLAKHDPLDTVAQRVAVGLLVGGLLGAPVAVVRTDEGLPFIVLGALVVGALGAWTAIRELRLREQALIQPITGLFHPALFQERLHIEVLRAQRRREPLSLLAIDLDCHARVVESGGTSAGERLLRGVSRCLRDTCRATDFIVHRRADEFMILAPATSAHRAEVLACRVRDAIAQLEDPSGTGIAPRPTVGAAELVQAPRATGDALIEAAQEALLIARARGSSILVLGPGGRSGAGDEGANVRKQPQDRACVRENEIIEADGTKSIELDIYCPDCDHWHAVEGRRRQSWADRTLRAFAARPFLSGKGDTRIAEVMTRDVVCVRPEMSIEALSTLFLEKDIGGAPVLDAAGNLIGAVGTNDILRNAWEPQAWDRSRDGGADADADEGVVEPAARLQEGFHLEALPRATVAEIMTPIVFQLKSDATLAQAAALMAYESVQRVVVVTGDGKVEGMVSADDVLRWVALSAGYVVPASNDKAAPPPKSHAGPILVVDDDEDLRETLADLLREAGYGVVTAANGAEALVALQLSQRPSLILLDLAMPIMSGTKLCAEISKDPTLDRIPLVLLSGSERLAREVGRIDADAFLSKPVEAERLLGTVRRYC